MCLLKKNSINGTNMVNLNLFLPIHHKHSFNWFFLSFIFISPTLSPSFLPLFLPFPFQKFYLPPCASLFLCVPRSSATALHHFMTRCHYVWFPKIIQLVEEVSGEQTFSAWLLDSFAMMLHQMVVWQLPHRQLSHRTLVPLDNCPTGHLSPWHLSHWTFVPLGHLSH